MSHCFASNNAGYLSFERPGISFHYFRWHPSLSSGRYEVTTVKPAIDEGKPAELRRSFSCVADDFGQLVEVPA